MGALTQASPVRPAQMPTALVGLSISTLMASLDTSIANAGLPTLAKAFGASFQAAQWIVLAYLLAVTTLIVSAGRLGDMVGRRRLLLAGISLFTVASAGCGWATELWVLIAARAFQGLGTAIMLALTLAFVSETVPKEKTGVAMGLLGTMSAVGTALGPSLGGVLISTVGWRAIFLVNLPIGLINLYLANRSLPPDSAAPTQNRQRFDTLGTLLLGTALAAYSLSLTLGKGQFGSLNALLLLGAGLAAAAFVFIQKRTDAPLIHLELFRNSRLSGGLAMSLLVSSVVMSTLVVGPFYLSRGLGLDPTAVGLLLSVGPITVALTGIPAGRITDRVGAHRMTVLGLVGIAGGSLLLFLLPMALGIPGYIFPIMLITSGYAIFQTSNNAAIMSGVEPEGRGLISGMLNLSRNLGLITGASLMGAIFAVASGSESVASAQTVAISHGLQATFATATVMIAAALGIAVSSRNAKTA